MTQAFLMIDERSLDTHRSNIYRDVGERGRDQCTLLDVLVMEIVALA